MFRGNRNPDDLTEAECYQYGILLHDMHNAVSLTWEQHQRGLVNREGIARLMGVASAYTSTTGGRAFWTGELLPDTQAGRDFFSAGYAEAVEAGQSDPSG